MSEVRGIETTVVDPATGEAALEAAESELISVEEISVEVEVVKVDGFVFEAYGKLCNLF